MTYRCFSKIKGVINGLNLTLPILVENFILHLLLDAESNSAITKQINATKLKHRLIA